MATKKNMTAKTLKTQHYTLQKKTTITFKSSSDFKMMSRLLTLP